MSQKEFTIRTGQGSITGFTLLAIWSISAMTSLPGLAISPLLGDLEHIFPHTSELEIQMLTSLPSLLIIPFVLLSGKLSNSKNKLIILRIGLLIFIICGALYFWAHSMTTLIMISCLLGVGAGMIIPLSIGLIANFFSGIYRTKQLGISSAINNLTLVIATLIAGWLANLNWHLPFSVYLLPIFALLLTYYLSSSYLSKSQHATTEQKDIEQQAHISKPILPKGKTYHSRLLTGLITIYFLLNYLVLIINFNIPFMMEHHHLSSDFSGLLISTFFLAIMLPGLFINQILNHFSNYCIALSFLAIMVGLLCIVLFHWHLWLIIGVVLVGLGYGVIQPIIYDKATLTATPQKIYFALAIILATNYFAILISPFLLQLSKTIFQNSSDALPFYVNAVEALLAAIIAFKYRNALLFKQLNKT